jgi:ribosomal protein L11 methyltransferase
MEWIQIQVFVSDESLKEAVSNFFFDIGAEGVSETIDKGVSQGVCACFPREKQIAIERELDNYFSSLEEIFPNARHLKYNVSVVPKDNWAEKYKEFYKAQKLTERFFLRPKWDSETKLPPEMFSLILDPGQAFGTGLHQSTRLSMKLIEDTALMNPDLSSLKLLDVGTGTGILAIVAHKLGFGHVVAIDNDEDAVRVAEENLKDNQSKEVKLSSIPLSQISERFDVIVSNILLETHLELCSDYQRLLKPGGILILAGLLGGQISEVTGVLFKKQFVLQQQYLLQEWAALSFTLR